MRKIGRPGRNQSDRSELTEASGLKIKTLPAMRVAVAHAFSEGKGPALAEAVGLSTEDLKPAIKNNAPFPAGSFGRLQDVLKAGI